MKPGNFVLDILKEAPKNRRTIVLIRHSKRDPFNGMPDHLREGVEITPDGILMAREFGESLGKIFPGKPLLLGHTVARRCRMTAESILAGYPPHVPARILGCEPEIKSPVVHLERYVTIRDEWGWREVIRKWLDQEIPEDTFQNPQQYSDYVLRNLFRCPGLKERDLFVVIAHDITLFPIISRVFGVKVKPIEFLNGIVITADTNTAELQYADAETALRAEWKIP
jgi:broad specificity phosphatase PhoE